MHQKDQKTLTLLHENRTQKCPPKNAQATGWPNAPPVSPSVGPLRSTTRMYGPAHYRAGNSVVGAVLGLRLSGPRAGQILRLAPHPTAPTPPASRAPPPSLPARHAGLVSLAAPFLLKPPHPLRLGLRFGFLAMRIYNNSHHFRSLLIAPSLFLPSILRVDPVAVRACSIGGESPG